jgi:hypothetical protein
MNTPEKDQGIEKRGRKPAGEISPVMQILDLGAEKEQEEELTAQKALELYGDGNPYERLYYMMKAKYSAKNAKQSILDMGRALLIIKAHEKHGGWMQTLKQIEEVDYYSAIRAMRIARRYGKFGNLPNLTYAKATFLNEFTNEEVEALNDGEEVNGTTREDWENLPVPMLRKKMSDYKKQLEIAKNRERDLNAVIEEKTRQYQVMEKKFLDETPEEKARQRLTDIDRGDNGYFKTIYLISGYLDRCITVIHEAESIPGINGDMLDEWMLKYEDVGNSISRLVEEWQDAVINICPDRPAKEPAP